MKDIIRMVSRNLDGRHRQLAFCFFIGDGLTVLDVVSNTKLSDRSLLGEVNSFASLTSDCLKSKDWLA